MSDPRPAQTVAARREGSRHTSMFLRMLVRAAVLRRGRAASALLAMVVAAAVTTAMLNLYVDAQAKLRKEFRNYGANVVVVGKDGTSLPADVVGKIEEVVDGRGLAVPFAYVVARTANGQSVVVAKPGSYAMRPDEPGARSFTVQEGEYSENDAKSQHA